ncbi:hypothetical protein ACRC6Q_16720 [Planococcus sp. SE5232]|uniref:hypothetical protein n=1 Tax=unclassified Planococcus (in: firmicutes) TaxID=2662419 RepID=UPI003D6B988E
MSKEVELKDAKYMVFNDFFPDPYIRGYANAEDAEEELNSITYNGESYMVEVLKQRDGS